MPRTPDRSPGPSIEEELQLDDLGADPTVIGGITNNAGALKGRDSVGIFDLRSGTGISAAQHEALDTLVHEVAEDAYLEVTRNVQGRVTNITLWTDSGKTIKIREVDITRVANKVSSTVEKQYDGAGTLITGQTLTSTISRTVSGKVASIAMVES